VIAACPDFQYDSAPALIVNLHNPLSTVNDLAHHCSGHCLLPHNQPHTFPQLAASRLLIPFNGTMYVKTHPVPCWKSYSQGPVEKEVRILLPSPPPEMDSDAPRRSERLQILVKPNDPVPAAPLQFNSGSDWGHYELSILNVRFDISDAEDNLPVLENFDPEWNPTQANGCF